VASRPNYPPPEKSITQALSEFKDELKEFASTRIEMLRSEMKEKADVARAALPAIAVGAVLALLALFFLCVGIVALVAMGLGGGAGAWAAAFGIVGGLFLLIGGLAIGFGVSKLKARSLKPERTLRILKQDQIWFKNETRNEQ
jgi:uncharacterized membrane protein YqjE